jgi:hypothetical protein
MDPIIWLVVAVIFILVLLRIFFKLAKAFVIIGILIVLAIYLWNTFVANAS